MSDTPNNRVLSQTEAQVANFLGIATTFPVIVPHGTIPEVSFNSSAVGGRSFEEIVVVIMKRDRLSVDELFRLLKEDETAGRKLAIDLLNKQEEVRALLERCLSAGTK